MSPRGPRRASPAARGLELAILLLACGLLAGPVSAQRHDAAAHFLDGSFRGAALRGLLPERILSGQEQPEAQASGEFDGRGGPEIAVVYHDSDRLALAIFREIEGGAWKKLTQLRREFPGVTKLHFVSFEHGAAQLLFVHWFIGASVGIGQLEAFAYRKTSDDVESILSVPATTYHLEDLDGDRVPELIAGKDAAGVAGIPDVYRWNGSKLVPSTDNLSKFYDQIARRFLSQAEAHLRGASKGQSPPLVALDELLNGAESLERAGRKDEAFRTYRRVASLTRSGLIRPRKTDPMQQFRDQRTVEAREGMARLLGKAPPKKPASADAGPPTSSTAGTAATPKTTH